MACRRTSEKGDLLRVVRTPEGEIRVDLRGKMNGRGAYLCKDMKCIEKALKTGVLGRVLKTHLPEEVILELRRENEA